MTTPAVRNAPDRTELSAVRRADGAVIVPAAIAGEVLRLLVRALITDARDHGGQPTPAARRLLTALYAAAQQDPPAVPIAEPCGEVVTVTQAAARLGCSTRWVRHLLATGRLDGHRGGGVWLVHWPVVPTSEARSRAS